ncbi:MAG TPA: hypothetical protein VH518_22900 [Tepidisphaeraceae bacterium]|jgi:hypothetical protein
MPRVRSIALMLVGAFFAGAMISVAVALLLARLQVEPNRSVATLWAFERQDTWHAEIAQGFGVRRIALTWAATANWSPPQAEGTPDTNSMGDIPSAWASLTPDGQPEWLELEYQPALTPKSALVCESNAPGALVRLTVFDSSGQEIEAWSGKDSAKPDLRGVYVAEVPLAVSEPVSRIKLYLDSPKVPGWNEIDAVGLIDSDGMYHWATSARASSTYAAQGGGTAMTFADLQRTLPSWAQDREVRPQDRFIRLRQPEVFEARGWPMPTLSWSAKPPGAPVLSGIVWPGLLIDGAFWGLALAALYSASFRLRRLLREGRWARRGCCVKCGYDLRFDLAAGCPECGWRRQGLT